MIPQSMKNQISKDVIINGKSFAHRTFWDDDTLGEAWSVQQLISVNNLITVLHL